MVMAGTETERGPLSNVRGGMTLVTSASLTDDHTLPPSPALSHSGANTPCPENCCVGPPADIQPPETAGDEELVGVEGSSPQVCQLVEVCASDIISSDLPSSVFGDVPTPEPVNGWQITDVHSLQAQGQEWPDNTGCDDDILLGGNGGDERPVAEENETQTVDPAHHKRQCYQLPQQQPPPPTLSGDEAGPDPDTGQSKFLQIQQTAGLQTCPTIRFTMPGQNRPPQPHLQLKATTSCSDTHIKTKVQLFRANIDPDLKSDRIDHNWKPLQITHNLGDKKKQPRTSFRPNQNFGTFQFQLGKKAALQANQSLCQSDSNSAVQLKNVFQYEKVHIKPATVPTAVSSPNMDYIIRDDSNDSDALLLDTEPSQESIRADKHAEPSNTDGAGSEDGTQVTSAHSGTSCPGYSSDVMDSHNYCLQPLSVEQYLFDFKDLPEFANIQTEDDIIGDMFELTPTIPPDALPSYTWQQQSSWYGYNSSSTHTTTSTVSTTRQRSATETAYSVVDPYGNAPGLPSASSAASSNASDFVSVTTPQPSSSSKTAVISATTTRSGNCATGNTEQQTPKAWTNAADPSHALHRSDPLTDALVTALGVETHISLTEMHSSGNVHPDQNLCDNAAMGYSSTLLSPPVTPGLEKDSGYLTTDDLEATPAGFTWPQYKDSTCGGEMDGSYTQYNNLNYHCAANRGRNGGSGNSGAGGPYIHYDSHHQSLNDHASVMPVAGGAAAHNSSNTIYYPFNDLMQLHPSLSADQEPSIHYISHADPHPYPSDPYQQSASQCPQQPPTPSSRKRRQAQGRGQGGSRQQSGTPAQIQSDQITSSLQRQQQTQTGAAPKRTYRRRSSTTEPRRKTPSAKSRLASAVDTETYVGEKKSRHNEPLNQRAVSIMNDWYCRNEENPYPTKEEKERMAFEGSITTMQVKSWFANKRNRSNNTRPKVQKRAMEEKLMQICRKAAGHVPDGHNSFIIKELSQIIHTFDKDGANTGPPDDD
ncbi:hypothetical protein BaRGS_00003178 [Batillaria attramentaria]|uniref:Homeobox domain-containing protein n=1 Tax=Batillaria attramentaria TaxID=370345 RepID=A0ABD0M176_9CAEN